LSGHAKLLLSDLLLFLGSSGLGRAKLASNTPKRFTKTACLSGA
jgi:hypothetical protein